MKKFICIAVLLVTLVSYSASASPKNRNINRTPEAMPKGYWLLKATDANPQLVTVYYYNIENQLVRKEMRTKRNANTRKKKVQRSLNRSLEEALDWAKPI